jgi:hypothetical protein
MANYSKIFCAFCRTPRRMYKKKHASIFDAIVLFALSFVLMMMIWEDWNPKVLLVWVGFMGISEIVVQMRWRIGLSCPHCGFDPVLYMNDRTSVVRKVKTHMARRSESVNNWVRPLPILQNQVHRSHTKTEDLSLKGSQVRVGSYENTSDNPNLQ